MISVETALSAMAGNRWFVNVGSRDMGGIVPHVVCCNSWAEALGSLGSPETADAHLEARGQLTRYLSRYHRPEYRKWNTVAQMVRERLDAEVLPVIDAVVDGLDGVTTVPHGVDILKHFVRWDLAHYAMELAYSDLADVRIYERVYSVYTAGHIPCGWSSNDTSSSILVF